MIKEGILCLLNPHAIFRVGLPYNPISIYGTVQRLEKNGLVEKFRREKRIYLRLTKEGRRTIDDHLRRARPSFPQWDQKWRVVIFDIPEAKTELRNFFRDYLRTLGFAKVQKSVWISPYDLEEEVDCFSNKLKISQHIFQILAEDFRGLKKKELAELFWNLDCLNEKYKFFIQHYSDNLNSLIKIILCKREYRDIAWRRYLANLLWDYHSIVTKDPCLPNDLLPSDWMGTKAFSFVKKCQAIANRNKIPAVDQLIEILT